MVACVNRQYVSPRVNVLEMENRQLQERNLKLSNQASSLERALKMVQSLYGSEVPLH